ncbi:MAG: molecular chaperone [Gemmatimonadota bacterium]
MTTSTLQFAPADDAEEIARAEIYGLLARLWLAAPDQDLAERMRDAASPGSASEGPLQGPWRALVDAMRTTSVEAAAAEYDALFEGVGRPEVFLYGSYYLTGFLNERPLARLRDDLQVLGLTRDVGRAETEDHVAFLFEVMRYLIAGDVAAVCNVEQQRRFFRAHLQPWVDQMCDAVEAHPRAGLWRAVAGMTRAFMQVETQGFDMLEER